MTTKTIAVLALASVVASLPQRFQNFDNNNFVSGVGQPLFQQNNQGFVDQPSFRNDDSVIEEPLGLSAGATEVLGNIVESFSCEGRQYGYYADEANDCRIFHVCWPVTFPDGNAQTFMWSFMCGNTTVFDQSQLTCVHELDALPCSETSSYLFINDEFGVIPDSNQQFVDNQQFF